MESLVEFEYLGDQQAIAVARLVREKPLNSLLLDTINELSEKIFSWLADDTIACIVLDSTTERAFCAGADITALFHSIKECGGGSNPYAEAFFLNEYKLDHAIHTATKPIVAWGNGIVMGGGLGLLGGCSHRIGTHSTRIAMPEITIGLFPDAGGTHFLSKLPDQLGLFAGLTGCQLSAGDALAVGLLDVVVASDDKSAILDALAVQKWTKDPDSNAQLVTDCLAGFSQSEDLPLNLMKHGPGISAFLAACLGQEDFFEGFDSGLANLPSDDWMAASIATYRAGSPTTARLFFEQMRRSAGMTLEEMFHMELVIAYQCIRHPDFPEGVRALLVDKDRDPQWTYGSASEIPDDYVEAHFNPVWAGDNPLQSLRPKR